ncbi:MAG TPA: hypothetical protein VMS65_09760 [Polyangiaceae bacterium]|nr:hypothetical protein [Polyangiaceae bacterium]
MSRRHADPSPSVQKPLLRRAVTSAFVALAFAGCIKRECVCPGEAGVAESGIPGVPLPKGALLVGPKGSLEFELHGTKEKVELSTVSVEG